MGSAETPQSISVRLAECAEYTADSSRQAATTLGAGTQLLEEGGEGQFWTFLGKDSFCALHAPRIGPAIVASNTVCVHGSHVVSRKQDTTVLLGVSSEDSSSYLSGIPASCTVARCTPILGRMLTLSGGLAAMVERRPANDVCAAIRLAVEASGGLFLEVDGRIIYGERSACQLVEHAVRS